MREHLRELDLDLFSSKALEVMDPDTNTAAFLQRVDRTLAHLKTGVAIDDASLPGSLPEINAYVVYLNAFRLELTMVELSALHDVLRGLDNPSLIASAASDAEARLSLLYDRLLVKNAGNR